MLWFEYNDFLYKKSILRSFYEKRIIHFFCMPVCLLVVGVCLLLAGIVMSCDESGLSGSWENQISITLTFSGRNYTVADWNGEIFERVTFSIRKNVIELIPQGGEIL